MKGHGDRRKARVMLTPINTKIVPKERDFWLFKHCIFLNYFGKIMSTKIERFPWSFDVLLLKLLILRSPHREESSIVFLF
jgi:hypothetical protein